MIDNAEFAQVIKYLKNELDGSYVPMEEQELINKMLEYSMKMLKEKDNLEKFDNMSKLELLKNSFKSTGKINLEALLTLMDKYADNIDKNDLIFIEKYTLSKQIPNKDKIFLYDVLSTGENVTFNNLTFFNNRLNKTFKLSEYDTSYYITLTKNLIKKLHKEPSLLMNAKTIIDHVQTYYFGFTPNFSVYDFATLIFDYLKGNKENEKDFVIIIRAITDSELLD
jgi:hypothetical protein